MSENPSAGVYRVFDRTLNSLLAAGQVAVAGA